jgi:hypothetical protein
VSAGAVWACIFADLDQPLPYLWGSLADMAVVHMVLHLPGGQAFVHRKRAPWVTRVLV